MVNQLIHSEFDKTHNEVNRANFYRSPDLVMKLKRIGSFHQSRLSFMRQLLRRVFTEKWYFNYRNWSLNSKGVGHIVYSVNTGKRTYSLVVFTHDIPPQERSDRVIATAWDLTFTLFNGVPNLKDIRRLEKQIPLQEAGRMSENELVLGRANRSVRLWELVVGKLASGVQPTENEIADVGYLMRTTAVYGSGKFGLADRVTIENFEEFKAPFQVELLAVYMLRTVVFDLVTWFAKLKGGNFAVDLDDRVKKTIGIGNSTGLGMAPFLVYHPELLNKWISARERAFTEVLNLRHVSEDEFKIFKKLLSRSLDNLDGWTSVSMDQLKRIDQLRKDLEGLLAFLSSLNRLQKNLWLRLFQWVEKNTSMETQELVVSLLLEPYARFVDKLGPDMSVFGEKKFTKFQGMSCNDLLRLIKDHFSWALEVDYSTQSQSARFWYYSQAKLEPRLGERYKEVGSDLEEPLAIGRDVSSLYDHLLKGDCNTPISKFLLEQPKWRHIVKRVLSTPMMPYGEIRDNLISKEMKPLDLLRCKLSFFGATNFDPRSDRWVRICMYQNAPLSGSDTSAYDDFWPY